MSRALHDIEIKLIRVLRGLPTADHAALGDAAQLSPDQVRRGVEWLKHKGLASVSHKEATFVRLGGRGLDALSAGLPERRLLALVEAGVCDVARLKAKMGSDFGPALGVARRGGWVSVEGGRIAPGRIPVSIPAEDLLRSIGHLDVKADAVDQDALASLRRRPDYVVPSVRKTSTVSLTPAAAEIDPASLEGNAMDLEAPAPVVYPAKSHPLREVINEIREIFALLGFTEAVGHMVQPSFWNFDALFTPQDHPAREMQDTFFLKDVRAADMASPDTIRDVADSHRAAWGQSWSLDEAEKMVLRTHTTGVTIKYLADNRPDEARVFSLGRVFRNEKVSYRHLVEFHQIEGVVTGKNATLRDLMGIQKEFYRRIGLERVKFWPTFFPYTEPSLQSMVYSDQLGRWIELFGMGIFRPQVTDPLGIRGPVLAWGGGIERIAMLMYGLDDVREFYSNNLRWLRSAARCR